METWLQAIIWLGLGLVALTWGGEWLVRGASRLSAALGISPLVIGLTVVAFGTSAPEFAVSLRSAYLGDTDLALGNVLGSNIFNVLFILGLSALITPLLVANQLIRLDVPLMILATAATWALGMDGSLGHLDGSILFGALIVYLAWLFWQNRSAADTPPDDLDFELPDPKTGPSWKFLLIQVVIGLLGLGILSLGSRWFVDGAVTLARLLGFSEIVIGLTVVAVGTSLPEIATSVMASLRGERDMAVGNIVGSNLFNLLGVLGLTALISPTAIPIDYSTLVMEFPVALLVAIACLPIFFTAQKIYRWEGALFLGYYVAYTTHLILHATDHDAVHLIRFIILWIALPVTVLLLGLEGWWTHRKSQKDAPLGESDPESGPEASPNPKSGSEP